jgi:hypothetical protein
VRAHRQASSRNAKLTHHAAVVTGNGDSAYARVCSCIAVSGRSPHRGNGSSPGDLRCQREAWLESGACVASPRDARRVVPTQNWNNDPRVTDRRADKGWGTGRRSADRGSAAHGARLDGATNRNRPGDRVHGGGGQSRLYRLDLQTSEVLDLSVDRTRDGPCDVPRFHVDPSWPLVAGLRGPI